MLLKAAVTVGDLLALALAGNADCTTANKIGRLVFLILGRQSFALIDYAQRGGEAVEPAAALRRAAAASIVRKAFMQFIS
jgi:hypothetical protein